MTAYVPKDYHSVTPSFTFKNSSKAIEFYKKAFGAAVIDFMPSLDGKGVMHATIKIGDSILMMGDEMPNCQSAETLGGSPMSLYLYVLDADAVFKQAVAAGASVVMPVEDMFWGDRAGNVRDPFGYTWMIATKKKELTHEEIKQGAAAFFERMSKRA